MRVALNVANSGFPSFTRSTVDAMKKPSSLTNTRFILVGKSACAHLLVIAIVTKGGLALAECGLLQALNCDR
jgi:hypothetical protein